MTEKKIIQVLFSIFLSFLLNIDAFAKSLNPIEFVILANPGSGPGQAPESSYFKKFWTPAFTGVTPQETFYEPINIDPLTFEKYRSFPAFSRGFKMVSRLMEARA
jgi:hypothetical protein